MRTLGSLVLVVLLAACAPPAPGATTGSAAAPVVFLVNGPQFFVSSAKVRGLEIPTPQFYNLDGVYKLK
jgi:hypothetical protein